MKPRITGLLSDASRFCQALFLKGKEREKRGRDWERTGGERERSKEKDVMNYRITG